MELETLHLDEKVPYARRAAQSGETTSLRVTCAGDAKPAIARLAAEYEAGRPQYEAELGLKRRMRQALRGEKGTTFEGRPHDLVAPAYVVSVASIQTPTGLWEDATAAWLDGDISLKTYLGKTEDGKTKYDCVRRTLESGAIEAAQSEFRRHHLVDGVRLLTGAEHDISTYLRGTKAWMVARWFFHVPCVDTNVHAAIEGILKEHLRPEAIHHPAMSQNAIGQAIAKGGESKGKMKPYTKAFYQERIGRYGRFGEMKALWDIVDKSVSMGTSPRIPREILAQVAFNVGGQLTNGDAWQRTTHLPVYEAIGRNLTGFEA